MKKTTFYFLAVLLFGFSFNGIAQTLDQNAAWPNPAWTVTGIFNPDPLAFEADPTITANFAYDDDDAGNPSDDDIAAESPIIDLTAAYVAGETWLTVTADYVYNFLADSLTLEYWDADAGAWVTWELIPENDDVTQDDFCAGTSGTYTSAVLNIISFTATQQSGFRYRISFLDDGGAGGGAWEWGFCFDAPTITSATPPSCPDPTALAAGNYQTTSADLSWTETGGAGLWDIEFLDITAGDTATGTPTDPGATNPFTANGLVDGNDYAFYVRADCGGDGTSAWVGPFNFTLLVPPPNDTIAGAIPMVPSPEGTGCGAATFTLPFSTDNTTDSGMDGTCNGINTGLDQFFTWTATSDGLIYNNLAPGNPGIVIRDIAGVEIDCAQTFEAADFVLSGWTIGQDLIIQIYDFAGSLSDVAFCLEEFALPMAPDCATDPNPIDGAVDVPVGTVTFTWSAPTTGPAPTGYNIYAGETTAGNDYGLLATVAAETVDLNVNAYAMTLYWIVVPLNGPTEAVGCPVWSFTTEDPPPPPANDDCANASILTPGGIYADNPIDGTVFGATTDAEDVDTCGEPGPGVWYSIVVPADGNITIETGPDAGTGDIAFDSVIEVFTGTCGSLTSIACDDDGAATDAFSLLDLTGLTAGSTIYVRVWEFLGDEIEPFSISAYNPSLGIEEVVFSDFDYFPNPVTDVLTLNSPKDIDAISVYNMLGQQILHSKSSVGESIKNVDMSSLETGAYFVKITIENVVETIRIIKE